METERLRNSLVTKLLGLVPKELAGFRLPNATRRTSLLLDGKFRLYVWLCHSFKNRSRSGWYLHTIPHENNGVTLICTVSPAKRGFDGFYVFPAIAVDPLQYSFDEQDEWLFSGVKLKDLSELCAVARGVIIEYAVPLRPNQGICLPRMSRATVRQAQDTMARIARWVP